jgi:nitrite reductase/ring-hydroxylating ferredoxin subunit
MRRDPLEPLEERIVTRSGFIRLGAILGLGPLTASALAACGSGNSGENDGGEAAGGSAAGGGPKIGKGQAIVKQSEVTANTAFPFTDADTGQQSVLVHLENGEFAAYSAICTHQACTVAYQPQTRKLACPCHGSVFDPEDGAAVVSGPAGRPLPGLVIEVKEGEVFLV